MGTFPNNVKITIGKEKKMWYNPWIAGAGSSGKHPGFRLHKWEGAECGKRECDK